MRVVVKIGSSSLTTDSEQVKSIDKQKLFKYVDAIAGVVSRGVEVVLVSSGAVAAGLNPLKLTARPKDIGQLQAAAAVGQAQLIWQYERAFSTHSVAIGQVLLTQKAIEGEERRQNIENTLEQLLKLGAVPIVNENDTVATEELTFGDNDQLAALVAELVKADRLVLLSDVDGLMTAPPDVEGSELISLVRGVGELQKLRETVTIGESNSGVGTGGMQTKLLAAEIALKAGIEVTLTNADNIESALHGTFEERLKMKKSTEFAVD